jgi:hypothetical protein
MRLVPVFGTVILTFITAVMLDITSDKVPLISYIGLVVVLAAFAINLVKFLLWGWLNSRHDLSKTYPLTALFYPLIFGYSLYKGQIDFQLNQFFGLLVILAGIAIFERGSAP